MRWRTVQQIHSINNRLSLNISISSGVTLFDPIFFFTGLAYEPVDDQRSEEKLFLLFIILIVNHTRESY